MDVISLTGGIALVVCLSPKFLDQINFGKKLSVMLFRYKIETG